MLWNGTRVPFTLLGGYLGAGKTTIVNHLLAHAADRRLVVLVNDVGAVNVDAALIADHDGETLTLTNGCVCCGIADDFNETLERVRSQPEPPDHIVMEMSGVGEPARLAPWANTAGFRLDGIIVAADAEQIAEQINRDYVGDTIRAQLAAAHLAVLTKVDRASDRGAAARDAIASLTGAPVIECVNGQVDPALLFGGPLPGHAVAVHATSATTPPAYRTRAVDLPTMPLDDLTAAIEALTADTLRAKGVVAVFDDGVTVAAEVQVVGAHRSVRLRRDLAAPTENTVVVITLPAGLD